MGSMHRYDSERRPFSEYELDGQPETIDALTFSIRIDDPSSVNGCYPVDFARLLDVMLKFLGQHHDTNDI